MTPTESEVLTRARILVHCHRQGVGSLIELVLLLENAMLRWEVERNASPDCYPDNTRRQDGRDA